MDRLECVRKAEERAGRKGSEQGLGGGGERGKGEENITKKMRGETLTSVMLSGPVADMTASVFIDRAISLPSHIACYSPVWHSTALGSIVS